MKKFIPFSFRTIKKIYNTYKISKKLKKIYKEDEIVEKLSYITNIDFEVDWVGRIYGIFNPLINIPLGERVFDGDNNKLLSLDFVNNYLLERLEITSKFIKEQTLFDYLTLENVILNNQNSLIIITPMNLYEDEILDNKNNDNNTIEISKKFKKELKYSFMEIILLLFLVSLGLIFWLK